MNKRACMENLMNKLDTLAIRISLSLSLYIYIYIYSIPRLVLFVPTLDGLGMGSVWDRFGVGLGSVGTSQ